MLYRPDEALLTRTLRSLDRALSVAAADFDLDARLRLVDNGAAAVPTDAPALAAFREVSVLHGHGNPGYGLGHNLALAADDRRDGLQLILNPDVLLADDALLNALRFLDRHPQAGLLAPAVTGPDGARQYLCKRYPSVLTLLLRGFAPAGLRRRFRARLERYELRDRIEADGAEPVWDVPVVSGCFMLIRRELLIEIGGFSARYFLYFEDFDLSLRLRERTRSVYLPTVRVVHFGGGAARKGWRHVAYFIGSARRFFSRHGWKWS